MTDPLSRLNRSGRGKDEEKKTDENKVEETQVIPKESTEEAIVTQEAKSAVSEEEIIIESEKPVVEKPTETIEKVVEEKVDKTPLVEDKGLTDMLVREIIAQGLHKKTLREIRFWFEQKLFSLDNIDSDWAMENKDHLFDNLLAPIQSLRLNQDFNVESGVGEKDEDETAVAKAKSKIAPLLMERIDAAAASRLEKDDLKQQIEQVVVEILSEESIQLNRNEQKELIDKLLDDMLGFGPLEPILADSDVTDILVNGPHQIYVERKGKLELSPIKFRDDAHVMNIATRIVSKIGRRIDETTPLCDARLPDGSRVNIIIPPLALDGPSISIRKFPQHRITLDVMARQGNISENMATVLKIAARSRLNILISGGTGSGKTTSLNAMSQMIDPGERIVTIEDAAELQLQQPHVVRLETRPPNLEGDGEITMRDLVKNSLRMRPDRVILGEIRGSEAVDMLQAMNTGHDGSLCTIHANTTQEKH